MILCETLLEEGDTSDIVKTKLDAYFEPTITVTFEATCFHSMVQVKQSTNYIRA